MSSHFSSLVNEYISKEAPFIGASADYIAAEKVIIGAPMDWTVSFRPGSRFGPNSIRDVSPGLELYSPYLDKSLADIAYYDAGNLELPFGNAATSLELIKKAVTAILADGKKPYLLGGEHLVSWPAIAATHAMYPNLVLLHFDAHTDLRESYHGETLSHASVIRRACELEPAIDIYQFGIRSGEKEEFAFAAQRTELFPFEVYEPLHSVLSQIKDAPIYLTLDIDVADPAFAPGTGTPEPGGVSSSELLQAIHLLQGTNLVGVDIVEIAPDYDLSRRTPFLGAKLLRELLLL